MLQNEYLVAKIGVDTEENEPSKVWKYSFIYSIHSLVGRTGGRLVSSPEPVDGPFAGGSTPIFATKYSFCSILRDLQNELAEFSKFGKKISEKSKIQEIFATIREFHRTFTEFAKISKNLQNF